MLRLKMVVNTVARYADNFGNVQSEEISMQAVSSDREGSSNKQWAKWTPSGQLKFTVNNPAAFGKVLPGQFIYVDLTLTDKDSLCSEREMLRRRLGGFASLHDHRQVPVLVEPGGHWKLVRRCPICDLHQSHAEVALARRM